MLNVSKQALSLLKVVLTTTGEKELNAEGNEVSSPLRLSGEESSQRRHFLKAVDPILTELGETQNKLFEDVKEAYRKSSPQGEMKEGDYNIQMIKALNQDDKFTEDIAALTSEKVEVKVSSNVIAVVKKYFEAYGDKNGWTVGDDGLVEEVIAALK